MATFDNVSLLKPVKALNIQAITTSTTTAGNAIDTKGFSSLTLFVEVGARTDGTYTPSIEHSDDGINFVDVEDQFLIGTEVLTAINTANTIKKIGYNGKKQFVKASIVSTSVSSGATVSITAVLGHAERNPVA